MRMLLGLDGMNAERDVVRAPDKLLTRHLLMSFNINKLVRFANIYYSLASSEELPPDSKDLKTMLGNLERLETYQARKKYAEKNMEHLSSGSSRIVYKTSENTVIKMAKNDRGIAQNKAECDPKMKSKFINTVISHAKNYAWMETHYLDKI